MKSVLLTTTAIVAFAGAAAADGHASITTTLSATLGYNDTNDDEVVTPAVEDDPATPDVDESAPAVLSGNDGERGFYWEGTLVSVATATLDNGITAGAFFEVLVNEDDDDTNNDFGLDLSSSDFVLSLEASNGGLFFGDTGRAAEQYWQSAGDMESDGFSTGSDSAVIRGDISVGPVQASVSYIANDAFNDDAGGIDDANDAVEQLSFGALAEFGNYFVTVGYQDETDFVDDDGDFNQAEIFGISGGGTVANATITVAYAEDSTGNSESYGLQVAYPFGPVTATGYYVEEEGTDGTEEDPNFGLTVAYSEGPLAITLDFDDDQGTTKTGIDGSYDIGNGLELFAGYYTEGAETGPDPEDEFYVAAEYDLGGGANILVSYAEGDDNTDDEIGANDYQVGTTVELTLEF